MAFDRLVNERCCWSFAIGGINGSLIFGSYMIFIHLNFDKDWLFIFIYRQSSELISEDERIEPLIVKYPSHPNRNYEVRIIKKLCLIYIQ